jgi:hypothetical protein
MDRFFSYLVARLVDRAPIALFSALLIIPSTEGEPLHRKPTSHESKVGEIAPTGGMAAGRSGHTATLLPNGKVLIAGGMERDGSIFGTAELYDPTTARFRPTAGSMTTPRVGHSAALLRDGRVLLAGGWDRHGTLATAELYDPVSDGFRATGDMGQGRGDFTATQLTNGKTLIAGGEGDRALSTAELYDPAAGKFSATGPMHAGRTMHTATLLSNGAVLITGGGDYGAPLSTAELYDMKSGAFTVTGSMSEVRYKHAAMQLQDSTVLVLGGSDARDWKGLEASTELYDPRLSTFSKAPTMSNPRFKFPEALVLLRDGTVLIAGGAQQPELYDPSHHRFVATRGHLDAPRYYSTATRLEDGTVLIAGGYDRTGVATKGAWLYRP